MGKCRGLRTARKLRSHQRDQKWHDKQYKKAHLGTALKANPFGGASHAKGIVLEKENDEVLVAGFGRKGHAVGDIPGVHFKVVKVANVSLLALYKGPPQTDMVESDQNWDLGTNQRTPPGRELLQCLDKDFSW
ncbi:hypothetical protein M91_03358 [Bos mutus]|uniref:Small ribosomal subunit protein uS12 n=1 Tax=Bos mutus TaxID=72004 RepID=L8HWD3_9CETA|nr:hypothetical protein M91_03358 [Bos mutus]